MASQQTCRKCGRPLDRYSPEGECPPCMLAAGLVAVAPAALAEEASMQLAPGATQTSSEPFTIVRFGDYELLEEIARGGMGIVYKARQLSLDRIVAIKRLLFAQYSSQEFIHRFRIEASAAASLQHPNIVAIHEVGVHQGQYYFAMDYVEGRDLANVLRDGPLSAKRAAAYVKAMAQAIQFAHQRGILHRDLKPSNVLIDSFDQPRITDFGLAKRLTNDSDLTLTGQVMGSPNYMPPEQASANRGQLGPHTDVYSLGAILYHALTGRPPFLAQSVPDTLQQVLHDEPIAPRLLNPSIPLDLATICLKCLEKEPGQRYASAQALADDLGRFLKDETILARPVNQSEKVWRWCRRKPVVASLAAAVSLLLVVVAVGSTVAALRVAAANREQQRENYYASIALADQYIREGSIARALEILFNCPSQFRHWEWGHLMYLCHQDVLSIQADTNDLFASRFVSDLHSLRFSPDSTRLATRSADGKVKVWELADGRSLFTFSEPTNPVLSVTFSPDGRQLALGTTNGTLKIFETLRWRELLTLSDTSETDNNRRDESNSDQSQIPNPKLQITHLAYSPDGKKLAVATANRTVSVWNIALEKFIFTLPEHSSAITQLRFTPDGQRLISQENFKVSIW